MNYQIIHDIDQVESFINKLPLGHDDEYYYCALIARNKYAKNIRKLCDRKQAASFYCKRDKIVNKIKSLELPLGSYRQTTDDGFIEIPQEALVMYINPNPRSMLNALEKMSLTILDYRFKEIDDCKPEDIAMSCIQTSRSRKIYKDFDIDTKNIDLSLLDTIFASKMLCKKVLKSYQIIETRGGYHILVNSKRADRYNTDTLGYDKMWYNKMINNYPIDMDPHRKVEADELLAIPGTIQGGFNVVEITI